MTQTVAAAKFKRLTAELDQAASSALYALNEAGENAPSSVLVVLKPRYTFRPAVYLLHDPENIDISVMVDLRAGLRAAASEVAKLEVAKPIYAISMIEIASGDLSFWLEKGFFPKSEVPSGFVEKDLVLFTASNASGQVVRRLSQFVSLPVLLDSGSRQLGRSVQVELSNEPSEMDVFWSKYKSVSQLISEDESRRAYL